MKKDKKKEVKEIAQLITRYFLIILAGLGNLAIFYLLFTPLTIYPIYWILGGELSGVFLSISNHIIYFSQACIAGAAYYLFFIFNLSTKIGWKKRLFSLFFSFFSFLLLNILRILILIKLYINQSVVFDIAHNFSWHILSTIFIIIIWFANAMLFKIKNIPIYTDLKFLYKLIF